ncbi:MAG: hypothetical protein RMJ39_06135 [Deltaproteobacteria bacterium]|nr:hypothetical protein [Deltaproteobacteria bacterium]
MLVTLPYKVLLRSEIPFFPKIWLAKNRKKVEPGCVAEKRQKPHECGYNLTRRPKANTRVALEEKFHRPRAGRARCCPFETLGLRAQSYELFL